MKHPRLFDLSGNRPRPFQSPLAEAKSRAAAREKRRKKIVEDFIQRNQPKVDDTGVAHLPGGGAVFMSGGYKPKQWDQPKIKKPEPRKKVELTDRQHRQVEALLALSKGRRDLAGRPLDEDGRIIEV